MKSFSNRHIILASGSPRRRELLQRIGLDFDVVSSDCQECPNSSEGALIAAELSALKCRNVAERLGRVGARAAGEEAGSERRTEEPCAQGAEGLPEDDGSGFIVIGSDTVVIHNGRVLGKPADEREAFNMLCELQGETHTVCTAVTLIDTAKNKEFTFSEETEVVMYPAQDEEIWEYIATKEPMDKAGAYGIQEKGAFLVREIHGDFYTVVGLPLARLLRELKNFTDL